MNSIQILASLTAVVGFIILACAIPLILRRIPPNGLYGVRTKASFASEADWYRINVIGGRYLTISALIIIVVGATGFFVPMSFGTYSITAAIVTLLAVFVPCLRLCCLKPSKRSNDDSGNA
jgi:uncharacterized membrane protein